MNFRLMVFLALSLGFLAVGYVYFFVWNKSQKDYAYLYADHELHARDLFNAFTADAKRASDKYNGKMILLSGDVDRVEHHDDLIVAAFVFSEGMRGAEGVRCTFIPDDEGKKLLAEDLRGKKIKGYCTGYNKTDVILEKCTITNQ